MHHDTMAMLSSSDTVHACTLRSNVAVHTAKFFHAMPLDKSESESASWSVFVYKFQLT